MANSETILTLTYDFLLYLIPQLSKYPRDQKFVLGDRIETLALDILDDVIVAYYSKQKFERLQNANLKLERRRFLIRLSHDLKLLSNQKYGVISEKINDSRKTDFSFRQHAQFEMMDSRSLSLELNSCEITLYLIYSFKVI